MPQDDCGLELMRLYRRLRDEPDPWKRDALKARIDAIVADARRSVAPPPIGSVHGQPPVE